MIGVKFIRNPVSFNRLFEHLLEVIGIIVMKDFSPHNEIGGLHMKKSNVLGFASLLLIALLAFSFTACNNDTSEDLLEITNEGMDEDISYESNDEEYEENEVINREAEELEERSEEQTEEVEEDDIQIVYIEGVPRKIMPPGSLTIEHFLLDLDYMVYVLENNFALLEVAYWAHGIDYQELAASAREMIETMEEPCEDMFLAIIVYHFLPLFHTGHFRILDPSFHSMRQLNPLLYLDTIGRVNVRLLMSSLASRFYEYRAYDDTAFRMALESVVEYVGKPLRNRLSDEVSPIFESVEMDEVITEIIEEDRIAYIYAPTMYSLRINEDTIFDFYHEISDFEHLIIDLRSNPGGNYRDFVNIILRPNITEGAEIPLGFIFFMDAPYIRRLEPYLFTPTTSGGYLTTTENYRPVSEILAEFDLPEINLSDLERFQYGAPYSFRRTQVTPRTEEFEHQPAFGGKIWLLTDSVMGSASQLAAWHSKETGFATLVGDTTGGNMGGPHTMALLPHTGIAFQFDLFYITDAWGRPIEAGTIPHHFNRPGMDALETALWLIEQGEY